MSPRIASLLALCLFLGACRSARPAPGPERPAPTEHRLEEGAEGENRERREAWMEERHRAAPEVDWRAIERVNAERAREARNQLAAMAAGGPSSWTERGSKNQAGRTHAAVPSSSGSHLYVGSSRGGVWRGTPNGGDWTPLGDNVEGGAHFLAVVPGDGAGAPDVIVRANHDGAVHVTRDEGLTWQVPAGLPNTVGARRALVLADGTHTIFLVLQFYQGNELRTAGFRSTDKALSFQNVCGMGTFAGDLWAPRNGAGSMYALRSGRLDVSHDSGDSWSTVSNHPVSAGQGELVGSEAGAPRLWMVLHSGSNDKLYRSDSAGAAWHFVGDLSDYWGEMQASIVDSNLFLYGGVEAWRTTNGGSSFQKLNSWGEYYSQPATKLHADMMGFDVHPAGAGGEIWYLNTDGGTYRSTNGLGSVWNLSQSGLRVSQYYTVHTSSADPTHVIAGSQDQGYQRSLAAPGGDGLVDFDQLISGDYGHATSGDGSHAYVYSVYPGFILAQVGENNPSLHQLSFPSGDHGPWMPQVVGDPYNNQRFFFCADRLWRYRKLGGNSWTSELWSGEDFGAGSSTYLTGLDFSPVNPERAYAVTDDGSLYTSNDHGQSWVESASSGPDDFWLYGTSIQAAESDADTAWVAGSGYSSPGVLRTTDGGQSWHDWSQGLPNTLIYCIAEIPGSNGALVAGTETGAWRRDPGGVWFDIVANEAPLTTYWSVQAVPGTDVMRFATYGRGLWDYDPSEPCDYEAYGLSAGGANIMTLDSASPVSVGATHSYSLTGGQVFALGGFLINLQPTSLPLFGGTLLVDLNGLVSLPFVTGVQGEWNFSMNFPSNPAMNGVTLHLQAWALHALQPQGVAFSNGLRGTFCP